MASVEEKLRKTGAIVKPGLGQNDVLNAYQDWENSEYPYDEVMKLRGYNGPRVTAEELGKFYDESQRRTVQVLDIGAGTGLVAEELSKLGFSCIDALEPSDALEMAATRKKVYRRILKMFLTKQKLDMEPGQYDTIVSCGAFIENHIPPEGLNEMIRLTKKGGHVVITTRLNYLVTTEMYRDKLEPYMEALEDAGKWRLLSRREFPKYYQQDIGIVWTYRVL